jgi:hypothetical protein
MLKRVENWKRTCNQAAQLTSAPSCTWDKVRPGQWNGSLSQDQITRVLAPMGTFNSLNLLLAVSMADCWSNLPNQGTLFANLTLLQRIQEGGIPE